MNKLLKQSLEQQKCIEMIYQSQTEVITQRIIKVLADQGDYIKAFCYLRRKARLFKKANILSVATIRNNRQKGA